MREKVKTFELDGKQVVIRLKHIPEELKFRVVVESGLPAVCDDVSEEYEKGDVARERYDELVKAVKEKIKKAREELEKAFKSERENGVFESELLNWLESVRPRKAFIYGHTGSGKTRAVLDYLKEEANVDEVVTVVFSSGMEDIDLMARFVPDQNSGKLKVVESGLWRAFKLAREGKRVGVLLDELNRAPARTLNVVLKLLDDVEGEYVFRNFVLEEEVRVPIERMVFIATANMGGYAGTHRLDEALFDRFDSVVFADYDERLERAVLKEYFGDMAELVREKVDALRKAYRDMAVQAPLSTRMLINWGREFKRCGNLVESAKRTFVYRLVDVDRFGFPDGEQLKVVLDVLEKVEIDRVRAKIGECVREVRDGEFCRALEV